MNYNGIKSKINLIDEDKRDYKRLANYLNYNIIGPLSQHTSFIKPIRSDMLFASIYAMIYGYPHDPNGYLLEYFFSL